MKVLVTGRDGQLGYDVLKRLETLGIECLGSGRKDFDLTNEIETREYIEAYNPHVVIHCAAYTAVDKAEDEQDLCYRVNVLGTRYVAQACATIGAKLVYISTDYVFDGEGDQPFEVTDKPNPINYYGQTKYQGELEVKEYVEKAFIVRISWVFGENGKNFVNTMLRLGKENQELKVVSDQVGSPTYTYDLAILITSMISTDQYGIYHATNEGYCSWYEFACEIFRLAGIEVSVKPIRTEEFPTEARRPGNSRLSKRRLTEEGFGEMPQWVDALEQYLRGISGRDTEL